MLFCLNYWNIFNACPKNIGQKAKDKCCKRNITASNAGSFYKFCGEMQTFLIIIFTKPIASLSDVSWTSVYIFLCKQFKGSVSEYMDITSYPCS